MFEDSLKKGRMTLTIKSVSKIIFQGEVAAVSFTNKIGPFDILPGHKNLIALVVDKIIIHQDTKRKLEVLISHGVVKVSNNNAVVYVGI